MRPMMMAMMTTNGKVSIQQLVDAAVRLTDEVTRGDVEGAQRIAKAFAGAACELRAKVRRAA